MSSEALETIVERGGHVFRPGLVPVRQNEFTHAKCHQRVGHGGARATSAELHDGIQASAGQATLEAF